jgi:hypothetical protein
MLPVYLKRLFSKDELVDAALEMCQTEYLTNGTDSIWCKFFDSDILKLFEYRNDIENNCKYGYRHEIASSSTCDLFGDLVQSLESFKNA